MSFHRNTQRFYSVDSYTLVNTLTEGTHCCVSMATVVMRTRYDVVRILPDLLLDRFIDSSANCTCGWVQEQLQLQKRTMVGEVLQICSTVGGITVRLR